MGSALGATTTERNVRFTADLALPYICDVVYDVDETGAKIITPKTVPKPEPPSLPFLNQGSFLGYYGKFHTTDSGEEEVELKVYDENGNTVGFLPGVVLPPAPTTLYAKWSLEEGDTRDNTEPIIFVCSRFFASENANLLEESNARIAADPADYEAYICRAFARVGTLWNDRDVKFFATGCCLCFGETARILTRRPIPPAAECSPG